MLKLFYTYQRGGFADITKQKILHKENLGLLWANFVSHTRFSEIPEGVEVINPGRTVAPIYIHIGLLRIIDVLLMMKEKHLVMRVSMLLKIL